MLVHHVLAKTVWIAVLLVAQGAAMPVFPVSVPGANVDLQCNCCLVEGATNRAELLVPLVRSLMPGQADRAPKRALAA